MHGLGIQDIREVKEENTLNIIGKQIKEEGKVIGCQILIVTKLINKQ